MDLVQVRWIDIASYDGAWMDIVEAKAYKPTPIVTCGWVVTHTEEYITLASSVSEDNEVVGNVNSIPKGVVLSITPVNVQGLTGNERS